MTKTFLKAKAATSLVVWDFLYVIYFRRTNSVLVAMCKKKMIDFASEEPSVATVLFE